MEKKFINCQTATHEELARAWNNPSVAITGIHQIGTHPGPHLDETAGMLALKETPQGRKKFPGIENAQIGIITATKLRAMNAYGFHGFISALNQGVLLIGVGEGPFDEHSNRKEKVSCLQLVIKYLQLDADKRMREAFYAIQEFVNYEDNHGDNLLKAVLQANKAAVQAEKRARGESISDSDGTLPKEVVNVLRKLQAGMLPGALKMGYHVADPNNLSDTSNVFCTGYNQLLFQFKQSLLFQDACDEYRTMKEKIQQNAVALDHKGGRYLLIIESDNPLMNRAALKLNPDSSTTTPIGALIVVKKTATPDLEQPNIKGRQFAIYPKDGMKEMQVDVYKQIQQAVHYAQHQDPGTNRGKNLSFQELGNYGTHPEVPQLYFDENQHIIMNGSGTDYDVPGLIDVELTIADIAEMIKTVWFKRFAKKHMNSCKAGICAKLANNAYCPLFASCLSHCKEVQHKTKAATQIQKTGSTKQTPRKGNN